MEQQSRYPTSRKSDRKRHMAGICAPTMRSLAILKGISIMSTISFLHFLAFLWKPAPGNQAGMCLTIAVKKLGQIAKRRKDSDSRKGITSTRKDPGVAAKFRPTKA